MFPPPKKRLGIVIHPDFELLDVFGPAEMFGNLPERLDVVMVAERAGPVRSAQNLSVHADHGFADCPPLDMLLIPGGIGTLTEVENPAMLDWLRARVPQAELVMTVCSGSALLAKTGLLDGRRATTNKAYYQVLTEHGPEVEWVKEARWVEDGKFVTSSGVSAGIDMALAVIQRLEGVETSETLATMTEYEWHRDAAWDPFARLHGLVS